MVGQPSWEQERPVFAPGVKTREPLGRRAGSDEPDKQSTCETGESGAGVGGGHSSGDGADNRTARSEGPPAECAAQRRGSGIAERLLTRINMPRRDGGLGTEPTLVARWNAWCRLLGGEPCAGEPHARF